MTAETFYEAAKARRQICAELPAEFAEADDLLTRYGSWAMDRARRYTCGSAEGSYRAPPNDDDRMPKPIPLEPADVALINRALQAVPDRERIVLHVLYVPKRLPPQAQLRILKIPARTAAERHLQGVRFFWRIYRILLEADLEAQARRQRRIALASLLLDRMLETGPA